MKVEVSSVNTRDFIQSVIACVKAGGEFTDNCASFKGVVLRTQLEFEKESDIPKLPTVMILPGQKAEKSKEVNSVKIESGKVYTKDELEGMTLAEVRKATGIKEGGKEAIIEEYLKSVEGKE